MPTKNSKLNQTLLGTAILVGAVGLGLYMRHTIEPARLNEISRGSVTQLKVPQGFNVEHYADVPAARQMSLSDSGILFVGAKIGDRIRAVMPPTAGGKPRVVDLVGFKDPNGVACLGRDLYVGEIPRIVRVDDVQAKLEALPAGATELAVQPAVHADGLPPEGHHGWKYIRFSPQGELFTAQGMPCNVCEKSDLIYGTILRLGKDKKWEVYASGVRNSVGFDWRSPGDLWFTDNGRDWLGDDLPPDELNHAPKPGLNFGFPYRYGDNVPDPEYGCKPKAAKLAASFVVPAQKLDAHVASLGMRFCKSPAFPPEYRDSVFIAEHGSWNRSKPSGYRITQVDLSGDKPVYKPFITGFQNADGSPWGRPVDLIFGPAGEMYISDDHAGAIYKVTYNGLDKAKSTDYQK